MLSQSPFQLFSTWNASTLAKTAAALFALATVFFVRSRRRSNLPLPPGPPARLLLGNLLDMSSTGKAPWLKWTEWAQSYGDVVHLEVLGQHIIVLNSPEACEELLVRRGANYSDRPKLMMASLGWSSAVGLVSQNNTLRAMRRMYTPLTSPRQVLSFVPLVEHATHGFLRRLRSATDGSAVMDLLRWLTGGNILKIVFGYTIKEIDDPFIRNADIAVTNFSKATTPGWVVDLLPILRHLPVWTPGATFLRQASAWKKEAEIMYDESFNLFRRQMAAGDYPSQSLIAKPLEQNPDTWMLDVIKYGLGSIYGAGSDTTVYAQQSFFLAMTLHSDVQRHDVAFRPELDAVTGGSHLPTYNDQKSLPYINSIVKEVFRWNPVVSAGFPHACRLEDEYRGWRIPAGSIILPNIWYLTHDATRYANPTLFNPDRFLGDNPEPNPAFSTFGFGRRMCPGRHLADISLFLTAACTLATFDISKQVDEDGVEIVPEVQYSGETISRPLPFPFKVTPRSEKALALLKPAN